MSTAVLECRPLAESDWSLVHDFLTRQDGPSLVTYSRPWYDLMRSFLSVDACYWLCLDRNRVVGMLPTLSRTDPTFGLVINSLPFQGAYGGVLVDTHLPELEQERIRRGLLERFYQEALAREAISVTFTPHPYLDRSDRYRVADSIRYSVVARVAQFSALSRDWEKSRGGRDYRRAVRLGGEVVSLQRVDDPAYLRGACVEMPRVGAKVRPLRFYQLLQQHLGEAGHARLWTAWNPSGQVVGGLIALFGFGSVEYLECWSSPEGRKIGASDLLLGQMFREALAEGCRWVGFSGSPTDGVRAFKAKWGAVERSFLYHNHLFRVPFSWRRAWTEGVAAAFPWFFTAPYTLNIEQVEERQRGSHSTRSGF